MVLIQSCRNALCQCPATSLHKLYNCCHSRVKGRGTSLKGSCRTAAFSGRTKGWAPPEGPRRISLQCRFPQQKELGARKKLSVTALRKGGERVSGEWWW